MKKKNKKILWWTFGILGALILAVIMIAVSGEVDGIFENIFAGGSKHAGRIASKAAGHAVSNTNAISGVASTVINSGAIVHTSNLVNYAVTSSNISNIIGNTCFMIYTPSFKYEKKEQINIDEPVRYKPHFQDDILLAR